MRLLALGLLSLFALLGDLSAAVRTKVDLVNLTPDIRAGEKALVALRYRCDPHFHIYWKNPGDAGASPTIEWTDKAGAEIGPMIWPGPTLLDQAGVMNFVYENETLILFEVSVPAGNTGTIALKGKAEWLECDDKGCWPHDTLVALTLAVGQGNPAYKYDPKLYPALRPAIATTATSDGKTLTIALPADRKLADTWFPERNFVTPNATSQQKKAGGRLTIELRDATESLTSGPLNFTTRAEDGGFIDINVKLESAATKAATETTAPHAGGPEWQPWTPEAQAKALADGKIVYVDFTARWCATCQVNKRVYKQDDVAKALTQSGVVLLKADWTKKDSVIADELRKYGRTGIPLNVFLKTGQPPAVLSEALTGTEVTTALKAVAAGKAYQAESVTHPFAFWLLLAFGGGVLLNLMPCVFPMIGLKVLGFAKEAGAARRTVVLNGLLYSAGVIVSFLALALLIVGLKSGGNSVGWGFQMQSPGFVLATCILMVCLGLSLAGVFEIGVSLTGSVPMGEGDGRVATFLSGVLATVVATPCTAPGLGAALGFALDKERSTAETLLFFTVIGLGMALPYLLLSVFPRLAALLPRPGEWMESLKQGMSFPLFAYALYLLWVLNALVEDAAWVRDASLGLALIATACWILGRWGALHRSDKERLTAKFVAGALFAGTLAYLYATLP